MNKSLIAVLLLVCAGALYAVEPSKKAKADAVALTTAATQQMAADAAQAKKTAKEEQAKAAAAKQDQEAEESVVMIDSKAEPEDTGAYSAEPEDHMVPGGLPLSYGQCKGIITDAGRSLLVFESLDDGTVTFVQITIGKTIVSWKLVARIPRSAD